MKARRTLLLLALAMSGLLAMHADEKDKITCPNKQQLEWADDEMGVLIHYDLQVFAPEYEWRKWGSHPSPDVFNPSELNTDQWIENVAKMGAKYAVMVVKHCSGFSLWPTKAHEHSVKNSPWKNGQGDLVADFIKSCKKYGIKPGLYASTSANGYMWVENPGLVQPGSPFTQAEYRKVVETQLTELWGNYGPLYEIWFDGGVLSIEEGGADVQSIINKLQPKAIVFEAPEGFDNRIRWVGNEDGHSPDPCWATCDATTKKKFTGDPFASHWNAGEADFTLRWNHSFQGGWFWHADQDHMMFTVPQLMDKYEQSVGHNTNMLMGIVVDNRGLVPDADVKRMLEFGDEIRRWYGTPLKKTSGKGNEVVLKLKQPTEVDRMILQEDIRKGERVLDFHLEGYCNGQWVKLFTGKGIGHKRIVKFKSQPFSQFRLVVDKSKAQPVIRNMAAFSTLDK